MPRSLCESGAAGATWRSDAKRERFRRPLSTQADDYQGHEERDPARTTEALLEQRVDAGSGWTAESVAERLLPSSLSISDVDFQGPHSFIHRTEQCQGWPPSGHGVCPDAGTLMGGSNGQVSDGAPRFG